MRHFTFVHLIAVWVAPLMCYIQPLIWLNVGPACQCRLVAAEGDLVAALRAAHADWFDRVEFRASYTRRTAALSAAKDVFSVATEMGTGELVARGLFHKSDHRQRISVDYGHPEAVGALDADGNPVEVPDLNEADEVVPQIPENGRLLIRNASFDEIFDLGYSVIYHPKWKDAYDHAWFNDNALRHRDAMPCCHAAWEISPLNPVYGCNASPFEHGSLIGPEVTHEARPLPDGRVVLVTTSRIGSKDEGGIEQVNEVTWLMEPVPPVIERVHRRLFDLRDGEQFDEICATLSDFVDCPGGKVARRVVSAREVKGSTTVIAQIWESADLGNRESTPNDFVIQVAATTIVSGLKTPPPPGEPRSLTLDMASPETLQVPEEPPVQRADIAVPAAAPAASLAARSRVWFWSANGIAVVAVALVFLRRVLRRQGRT